MKHRAALAALACTIGVLVLVGATTVAAPTNDADVIPTHCVECHELAGPDSPGDYRCAGLMLTIAGQAPMWAGQWLFRDGNGVVRVGIAASDVGAHPTTLDRAQSAPRQFPGDPGGGRLAFLAWKYGDTTDDLTAAALWVLIRHYAGDALFGGALANVAAMTGRDDLQRRVDELDFEAGWCAQPWSLSATTSTGDDDPSRLVVTLRSGAGPVPGRTISVLVSGLDRPLVATTGTDGSATVAVPSGVGQVDLGTATVVVTTEAPGPAVLYRSSPEPSGVAMQNVLTAGRAITLKAVAAPAPEAIEQPTMPSTPEPLPHTGSHITEVIAGAATGVLVAGIGLVGAVRRRARALLHSGA